MTAHLVCAWIPVNLEIGIDAYEQIEEDAFLSAMRADVARQHAHAQREQAVALAEHAHIVHCDQRRQVSHSHHTPSLTPS